MKEYERNIPPCVKDQAEIIYLMSIFHKDHRAILKKTIKKGRKMSKEKIKFINIKKSKEFFLNLIKKF